jgi:hypothetical protein
VVDVKTYEASLLNATFKRETTPVEDTNPITKAQRLLAGGLDQPAAMKKLRKDGLTVPEAMQAIQKALSQNFIAPSKEEAAMINNQTKKKQEVAKPVTLYFKVFLCG